MFTNNNLAVLNFSPLDTVITPAGVPVPLVNLALSTVHVPSQFKVLFGCGLSENLLTQGTTSLGDQAGIGVASGINSGPDRAITFSINFFIGGIPSTKLTTINIQNLSNTVGMSSTPGQIRVLSLR
jgi:hypothetical protein